eukprot:Pgem_evm1s11237
MGIEIYNLLKPMFESYLTASCCSDISKTHTSTPVTPWAFDLFLTFMVKHRPDEVINL